MSPLCPCTCLMEVVGFELGMTYQVVLDGRQTAISALRSPSKLAMCLSRLSGAVRRVAGTSPETPHAVLILVPPPVKLTYHVPFEGRHTAKSFLWSPS